MVELQSRTKTGAKQKQPEIVDMPTQKMAVVHTMGDPNKIMHLVMPALYSSVYKLKLDLKKQGRDFKLGPLRARWPNAHLVPKDEWFGAWGLPIPNDTTSLPQKFPHVEVEIEEWEYGTVAQVLHIGPYSEEGPAIQRLHDLIAERGYAIAGAHEEEYLTSPQAKVQKSVIRYPVKQRVATLALMPQRGVEHSLLVLSALHGDSRGVGVHV